MSKLIGIVFVILTFILPHTPSAAGFDGSSPLLCAGIEAFGCDIEYGCIEGTVESMDIPQFVRIDFGNNKISTPEGSKEKRVSVIKNFKRDNGVMILQGIEDGRGWSIIIAEDTGKMTATASQDDVGFVIFGACTLD
jgi:hypothetical protein